MRRSVVQGWLIAILFISSLLNLWWGIDVMVNWESSSQSWNMDPDMTGELAYVTGIFSLAIAALCAWAIWTLTTHPFFGKLTSNYMGWMFIGIAVLMLIRYDIQGITTPMVINFIRGILLVVFARLLPG